MFKLKGTTIEKVPKFNYLGAEISAKRDLKQEVRVQATKAARISGCLYITIWFNKYRVIHKSLRNFRTRLRNKQDRHGRKEHINR